VNAMRTVDQKTAGASTSTSRSTQPQSCFSTRTPYLRKASTSHKMSRFSPKRYAEIRLNMARSSNLDRFSDAQDVLVWRFIGPVSCSSDGLTEQRSGLATGEKASILKVRIFVEPSRKVGIDVRCISYTLYNTSSIYCRAWLRNLVYNARATGLRLCESTRAQLVLKSESTSGFG
jgi:hypothetical protein